MSLVESAMRRRADEVGRWMPSSLPAGVSKWVPFLLQREWRRGMERGTVAAAQDRSFFVDADGALLVCGAEEKPSPLGLRGGSSQTPFTAVVPTPVPSLAGVRVRAVACRYGYNLAVSEAGQVFAWGDLEAGGEIWNCAEYAVEPTVIMALRNHRVCQIVVGEYHCATVTEDWALFTWESRRDIFYPTAMDEPMSHLGYGSSVLEFGTPYRIFALASVRITSVATGAEFTVAVTEAGAVYSFGFGDGRLGHGQREEEDGVYLPKRIEALDGIYVTTVAAGRSHALALTRCGQVYSWGPVYKPDHPELGRGNGSGDGDDIDYDHYSKPELITALLDERVRAIAAGSCISCAVTEAGALYTWGDNTHGNLGHGNVHPRNRPTLVQGLDGIRVVGVSVDAKHTLALAADGSVYVFGKGPGLGIIRGGEGAGGAEPMLTPERIPKLTCMVPR
jgi:alpha-tubulin suppressor-like RCC1 family protein